MQYLYLTPSVVFPCDISDLRYALQQSLGRHPERYLESWPGHGHDPEWRMQSEHMQSVVVLDLSNNGVILSVEALKKLGVWPEEVRKEMAVGVNTPFLCTTENGIFVLYHFPSPDTHRVQWHSLSYDGVGWYRFPWKVHQALPIKSLPEEVLKSLNLPNPCTVFNPRELASEGL